MNRFYVFLMFFVCLIFAYVSGVRFGTERAKRAFAETTVNNQTHIVQIQEKVNAEVLGRGADDIRDILRQKYTIAE
jgi:hypothetical protein